MAKKSTDSDVRIKSFDDMNIILKNSFSGIKKDMLDIKESVHLLQAHSEDTRKLFEDAKKDFVTVDKLNAIKIKVADMNEEVKRLDRIDNSLKKIDSKSVDSDKFEAERQKNKATLDELKNQVNFAEKLGKGAVTEARLKQLSKEVSAEINEMIKRLDDYEKKGGMVVDSIADKLKKEIDKKIVDLDERFNVKSASLREEVGSSTSQMRADVKNALEAEKKDSHKKMLKLLEGINKIREENRKLVNRNQMNDVLRGVNTEFDGVKEHIADLQMLKKDLKQIRKDKVSKTSYEQHMNSLQKKVDDIQESLIRMKDDVKESRKIQKEAARKAPSEPKPQKSLGMIIIANICIALAFVLLGVSFLLYFFERAAYMNYVIIGAVVFFIIGIIIRIVSVLKS